MWEVRGAVSRREAQPTRRRSVANSGPNNPNDPNNRLAVRPGGAALTPRSDQPYVVHQHLRSGTCVAAAMSVIQRRSGPV